LFWWFSFCVFTFALTWLILLWMDFHPCLYIYFINKKFEVTINYMGINNNGPMKVLNFISKVLHVIHYWCLSMVWPLVKVGLKEQNSSLSIRAPCGMYFVVKRRNWIFLVIRDSLHMLHAFLYLRQFLTIP